MIAAGDNQKFASVPHRPVEDRPVEEVLREEPVMALCREPPVTVARGASLREAIDLLRGDAGKGAVLVVEGESLSASVVGIFTERDYLDKIAGVDGLLERRIDDFMSANPRVLRPTDTVAHAIRLMTEGGYRHLPVVEGEARAPIGLVSTRDIATHLAEHFPMEVLNLPPRLDQDQPFMAREGG